MCVAALYLYIIWSHHQQNIHLLLSELQCIRVYYSCIAGIGQKIMLLLIETALPIKYYYKREATMLAKGNTHGNTH